MSDTPTMIGHGIPPGPLEDAINRAFEALIERCHKAEARVRELESETPEQALARVLRQGGGRWAFWGPRTRRAK